MQPLFFWVLLLVSRELQIHLVWSCCSISFWTNFVHLYPSGFVPCKFQDVKEFQNLLSNAAKIRQVQAFYWNLPSQKIAATVCERKFSPEIWCSNFQSKYTTSRKEIMIFHLVNGKDSTVYCNQVVHFRLKKHHVSTFPSDTPAHERERSA